MPSISVNENGTELFYEDTGVPQGGTEYTTVVVIHGSLFHSGSFKPLVPYAAKHGLRLVLLNTRDYPGSTTYSQEQLAVLQFGSLVAQQAFVRDTGREIATFLQRYIRQENIPPLQENDCDHRTGGLVLMAWSSGNFIPLSLLAHGDTLQDETQRVLASYIRTVVLYDPTVTALGLPHPEGVYNPIRDSALPPKERSDAFLLWISAYFPPIATLADVTPALLTARVVMPDDPNLSTVKRMSSTDLASCTHLDALRSNLAFRQVDSSVYAANLRRAAVDTGGQWSKVKLLVLWCDRSNADCIWGAKGMKDMIDEELGSRDERRQVEFVRVEGANHFVHWDEPHKLMNVLATMA